VTSEGPLHGRADQMARSLRRTLRSRGVAEDDAEVVERVYGLAMTPRVAALDDDHHPAYLHPGRSVLILLQDVGVVDPTVLVVAALHESVDADLAVAEELIAEAVEPSALEALASIPLPGDEQLVERLVTLEPGVGLAALSERLDQLRHLHLRPDLGDLWAAAHAEVSHAWLPFAQRTHLQVARRYAHWTRTFARRLTRS